MIVWKKKDYKTTITQENQGVVWIEHMLFQQAEGVRQAFSTRLGGVSEGVCASMNLRNCEWDTPENYRTNMERFCEAAGFPMERIVATHQTHTNHVEVVREADIPHGTLFERQYQDVDGLVTNVPGAVLVTSFADCIPLFFYDPVARCIGSSHAGWRGTVSQIGPETLRKMTEQYGSDPTNVLVGIGPGICRDCYEVSEDVRAAFAETMDERDMSRVFSPHGPGHYLLDLWEANAIYLERAGVLPEHISRTDICTRCNPDMLFSHRVMGNARGNQCGFLMLTE